MSEKIVTIKIYVSLRCCFFTCSLPVASSSVLDFPWSHKRIMQSWGDLDELGMDIDELLVYIFFYWRFNEKFKSLKTSTKTRNRNTKENNEGTLVDVVMRLPLYVTHEMWTTFEMKTPINWAAIHRSSIHSVDKMPEMLVKANENGITKKKTFFKARSMFPEWGWRYEEEDLNISERGMSDFAENRETWTSFI